MNNLEFYNPDNCTDTDDLLMRAKAAYEELARLCKEKASSDDLAIKKEAVSGSTSWYDYPEFERESVLLRLADSISNFQVGQHVAAVCGLALALADLKEAACAMEELRRLLISKDDASAAASLCSMPQHVHQSVAYLLCYESYRWTEGGMALPEECPEMRRLYKFRSLCYLAAAKVLRDVTKKEEVSGEHTAG